MIQRLHLLIEEILTSILLSILALLTFINVIMRYFFGDSLPGIVEISGLIFIWVCMIGSSLAFKHQSHITVDIVLLKLPTKYRDYYQTAIYIIMMVSFVIVVYYGFLLTVQAQENSLGSLSISQSYVYAAVPFGFTLMFIRLLVNVFLTYSKKRS